MLPARCSGRFFSSRSSRSADAHTLALAGGRPRTRSLKCGSCPDQANGFTRWRVYTSAMSATTSCGWTTHTAPRSESRDFDACQDVATESRSRLSVGADAEHVEVHIHQAVPMFSKAISVAARRAWPAWNPVGWPMCFAGRVALRRWKSSKATCKVLMHRARSCSPQRPAAASEPLVLSRRLRL
jgi:hypothetical protein